MSKEKFWLAPVEPTEEMVDAGDGENSTSAKREYIYDIWNAMRLVAPTVKDYLSVEPTTLLEPVAKLHVGPLDTGPFHIDPTPYGWDHLKDGDHNVVLQSDATTIIAAKDAEIERLSREASACDMIEEYRQDAQTTADAIGHIQQQFEIVNNDRDDWIACHAKIFRELQETKTLLGNKCAEVERLTRERETWQRSKDAEKRNELREQLAAAQRDAERYRFIKPLLFSADFAYPVNDGEEHIQALIFNWQHSISASLDASIDAAMQGKEGE